MNSYNAFAKYYDALTSNISYGKRAEYFKELIDLYGGKQSGILLELACGTGSLSEKMADFGFDVIGIDCSQEMLSAALDKKLESGNNIQYLCQDMRRLDMFGTVDIVLCALDGLNHLPSLDDIDAVFSRVSLFLEPGGLFIFDVNTEYKHRNILSDNVFVYETDEVYCIWQNNFIEKNCEAEISLDFFEKQGKLYKRSSEYFSEFAYPNKDIDSLLIKNGLDVLAHFDFDSRNPVKPDSEKVIFCCRKK